MISKKLTLSLLAGAFAITSACAPAFPKDPNGYAANQMAMQMWMNQQANNQQQAYWNQQQAINNYYAAQNAWAQNTVPPAWATNNGYGRYRNNSYGQYYRNAYGGERWGHYHHHNGW